MLKRVFPVLGLSVFAAMLGSSIIAPLLPIYARDMGATGILIGVIFASFSLSKALIMPFIGRYSDRTGRKRFLITGLLIYSLVSLGYIWVTDISQLIIVRVIHGAASGMITPVARAYVGDLIPKGEEGKWMGYFNAAFFSGMGFGPLMGGLLTDIFTIPGLPPMATAFVSMGGLSFLALLGVIIYLPDIKQTAAERRPNPSFRQMSRSNVFRGVFTLRIWENMGRRSFFSFLPIYAGINLGFSASQIGMILTTSVGLSAVLQAVAGRIVDRLNKKTVIIVTGLMAAVYFGVIPLVTGFWTLMVIAVINGFRASMHGPASAGMMVEEGRKFGMGSTMAMFSLAIASGEALGPLLGGVAVDLYDVKAAFWFGSFAVLVGILMFSWFTRKATEAAPAVTADERLVAAADILAEEDIKLDPDTRGRDEV